MNDINKGNIFPLQKLPLSKKNDNWRKKSVDALIGRHKRGDARHRRMKNSYDIMNSIFDMDDLKYVIDPYKVKEGFPAKVQNVNIIRPKIEVLKGEQLKRPNSFHVFRTDERAVKDVIDKEKELLIQAFQASLMMTSEQEASEYLQQRLKEINDYIRNKYYSPAEQTADASLKYLKEKVDIQLNSLKTFEDGLVAGEATNYVGIIGGDPVMERVNPLTFSHDRDPELRYVEDGEWAVREMLMTLPEIWDRFSDIMKESDFDYLLERISNDVPSSNTGSSINTNYIDYYNEGDLNTKDWVEDNRKGAFISVYHCVWKSFKKIGYLTYIDENGDVSNTIVDETYKKRDGETIEWDWIVEIWEGYRFWKDIYSEIRPIEYQHTSLDDPNAKKLPYVGVVFNTNNTDGKSLVEIMKPLQYFYITLFYRLELAIARDAGKPIVMDITQIPKSAGLEPDKWLHYLKSLGVAFINPYECFAPGTKVMMADGLLKNIEDIEVDDLVMGPDGRPRKVLHTHSGVDDMFRIKCRTGCDDQIVNSTHKNYYFEKDYYKDTYHEKLSDAREIMKEDINNPYKEKLRYLKRATDIDLNWDSEVELDPYLLGLWLGDGSTGKVDISNTDSEIVSYLEGFAKDNDLKLSVNYESRNSNVMTLRLYKEKGSINPIKKILNKLKVLDYKHIPDNYIYTNRDNRLRLLAGLLDTDGSYNKRDNYYTFSQSENRKHIVEQAAFIARSLGFKCSVHKYEGIKEKYICDSDNISLCQPIYVLNILEWDKHIPTKIERKKATICNKRGDKDYSNFKVEYEGLGDFHGIHIDGDNLFLLEDFTIVHNTGWDIPGREGGKPSGFNQISSVDMTMQNVISEYIVLMNKVEEMVEEISGISRERQGGASPNQLVGNLRQNITQSSHITESLFFMHDRMIKNSLNMLLNVAKYAWKRSNKQYINHVLGDSERIFVQITDDFLYSDYDIFVTNSSKEVNDLELIRSLYQPAMQNGASLTDIATMMISDNMSELKMKLDDIEKNRAEIIEQQSKAEQAIAEEENRLKQEELRIKEEDSIRKAEVELQIAAMDKLNDNEDSKLNLQRNKQEKDYEIKDRQLNETERHNRVQESIAKNNKNSKK